MKNFETEMNEARNQIRCREAFIAGYMRSEGGSFKKAIEAANEKYPFPKMPVMETGNWTAEIAEAMRVPEPKKEEGEFEVYTKDLSTIAF